MSDKLVGRTALIVGASRGGTGTGVALRLAAEGAKVAVVARSEDKLRSVLKQICDLGREGAMFVCDVSDPGGGRETLVARTEEQLGPLDYLVYVAAGGTYQPIETVTTDQLQQALELNVLAPYVLAQHAIASMRSRESRGAIVNIGTKAALPLSGPPYLDTPVTRRGTVYGGTKAALHRITQGMAAETHGQGISVNIVRPLAAIGTPELRASGWIPEELFEPVETMVEAVLALLVGDPDTQTGLDVSSIELLYALRRPVFDFTGNNLVEKWQPDDLPAFITARSVAIALDSPTPNSIT
jgi:NAD(P)-dependent dehydrogenase (short-subunit alcohol dehydrogenase family)